MKMQLWHYTKKKKNISTILKTKHLFWILIIFFSNHSNQSFLIHYFSNLSDPKCLNSTVVYTLLFYNVIRSIILHRTTSLKPPRSLMNWRVSWTGISRPWRPGCRNQHTRMKTPWPSSSMPSRTKAGFEWVPSNSDRIICLSRVTLYSQFGCHKENVRQGKARQGKARQVYLYSTFHTQW